MRMPAFSVCKKQRGKPAALLREQTLVVQSIVSLTTLLLHQLVKYMLITLSNTLFCYFLLKKKRESFAFFVETKNNSIFVIFAFKILTKLKLTTSLVSNNRAITFVFAA